MSSLFVSIYQVVVVGVFLFLSASWDLGGAGLSYGRENLLKLLEV
jgi:hypothetical protein